MVYAQIDAQQDNMDYTIALNTLKQADPALATLIDRVGVCRLDQQQLTGDVLYALTRAIVYQQLSGKAAATIHQRFLQLYPHTPAPTAIEILNTPDEALRGVGLSRSKALYIKDLAEKVLNGLPSLAELETMEDEAIIETLIQVKGVGRWTAQMLLIFRLHRWNVLPINDLGVQVGIRKLYDLEETPAPKAVTTYGELWQPYRTIASWYLWRSLD
ncbi:MAG: DNA-3-methyladenine glycosylase [Elainellaceae cyanobacterium]